MKRFADVVSSLLVALGVTALLLGASIACTAVWADAIAIPIPAVECAGCLTAKKKNQTGECVLNGTADGCVNQGKQCVKDTTSTKKCDEKCHCHLKSVNVFSCVCEGVE